MKVYSCNNPQRAQELNDQYSALKENYCGLPLSDAHNVDTELVSKVVADLKRSKAAGIDGMSAEHLLYSHPCLSVLIAKLYQLMITCRYVPRGFRYSYIVPISKPKEHYSKSLTCEDFRGIAISPILSKVFEYCILNRFGEFLSTSDNQFGSKKGLSCSIAIKTVRNIVDNMLNRGSTVNLCAIDLAKAFDKVNHQPLFLKLMER